MSVAYRTFSSTAEYPDDHWPPDLDVVKCPACRRYDRILASDVKYRVLHTAGTTGSVGAGKDATQAALVMLDVNVAHEAGISIAEAIDRLNGTRSNVRNFCEVPKAKLASRRARGASPGKHANFAVLDMDYFAVPDAQIKSVSPVLTIMNGKVVFVAQEYADQYLLPPIGINREGFPFSWMVSPLVRIRLSTQKGAKLRINREEDRLSLTERQRSR